MLLKGGATFDGTTRYRERFQGAAADNHFRLAQNRWLSSIGIGTYLGQATDDLDASYADAVVRRQTAGNRLWCKSRLRCGQILA